MIHVAILKPGYIHAILAGRKTIESRLTKTMQSPHGKVQPGERLFIKASGGPFMAMAIAGPVHTSTDMKTADLRRIRKRYGKPIGGDDAYWEMKKDSRFATLIELKEVEPIAIGPKYKVAHMKAWYVLDERLSPLRDWVITAGALRNRYACLPMNKTTASQADRPIALELPDGSVVMTDMAKGRMLRWRGWGPVYASAGAVPGDVLRFIAVGPRRYAVRVVKA